MKILMVTATYTPSANGVAVSVENLKNTLQKLGHDVKVLAPNVRNAKEDKDVIRYASLKNPFVKDYPIPIFPGLKSVYKIVTSFRPDVVHAHHPFQVGFFAKLIADNFGVPLVFTYHTMYDLYATKYARFLPNNLKVKVIEKNVDDFCNKVDLIIAPSLFLQKKLSKKYPNNDVAWIPSALPKFLKNEDSKQDIRIKLKIGNDKKVLLCISRLAKEKNIELLIKSIQFLPPNYLLLLVGSGPDEKNLIQISEKLKTGDKVKFIGKVPHEKVNLYYQAADIFYYSSKTETQGLVFLEAMNFGLPIIAVESPASSEWLKGGVGIVVKNDSKELAKSVLDLNTRKITNYSKKAKKYSQGFTQEKITAKVVAHYERLINQRND